MALTQSSFRQTAERLFDKAQAGNLTSTAVFSLPQSIDPITGASVAGASDTAQVVPESYDENQIDGQAVRRGDFKLLARFESFSNLAPTTGGVKVAIDGNEYAVVNHKNEFDILYTLQVRAT